MIDRDHALSSLPDGRLLIGNERHDAGETLAVEDPARGEEILRVASAAPADVDRAVAAARDALPAWRDRDARDRGHLLSRLARLVKEEAETLAALETLDVGKPFSEARHGDLAQVVDALSYFAGAADKLEGRTIPVRGGQRSLNMTHREPVGVVAAIIPWNFPLLMAAWKLAPALACGCTVVLKPAEQTPLTALRLADLVVEAGFPPGVVNVIVGTGEVAGAALVAHPDVDKIAFTGSTATGRRIMAAAAANLTPVSLELGGKSANVFFADAGPPERLVKLAARAVFYNQGQCCTAGSRILVERSLHDDFVARLVTAANDLVVGDPFHRATAMGAQVSAAQRDRVLDYVARGKEEGARCVAGGGPKPIADFAGGYFLSPTVFTDVAPEHTIAREEIFGPVVTVFSFESEEEALALANGTPYGLAAGVWTRDLGRGHRMARGLEAGTVWVNGYNRFDAASPFGGVKASGFGRENGRAALDLYSREKSVWIGL